MYRAGRDNLHADALSRQPNLPPPDGVVAQEDLQVCTIRSTQPEENTKADTWLEASPKQITDLDDFATEQRKDSAIQMLVNYLEQGVLPEDTQLVCKITSQAPIFTVVNQIVYYVDPKRDNLN